MRDTHLLLLKDKLDSMASTAAGSLDLAADSLAVVDSPVLVTGNRLLMDSLRLSEILDSIADSLGSAADNLAVVDNRALNRAADIHSLVADLSETKSIYCGHSSRNIIGTLRHTYCLE